MSVLVTGGAGFVGLNILEALASRGVAAVSLDIRNVPAEVAGRFAPGAFSEVIGDVCDAALLHRIMADHGVTSVVHAAAITAGLQREQTAPARVVAVNLGGLAACLEAAMIAKVGRFVYVSSVAVFGTEVADGALIAEDHLHAPTTLYAITKSAGEAIVARLAAVSGLSTVIGRLGVVYGRHETHTGARDTMSPFYYATQRAMTGGSLVLPRPARRNWQYGSDAGEALAVLALAQSPSQAIYNLGPSVVFTVLDWCALLQTRYPSFKATVGDVPGGPVGLHNPRDGGLLSWQRFEEEFGVTSRPDLDGAFADYMAFMTA